jgi:predicted CoA-substrate-specific enzyme activase
MNTFVGIDVGASTTKAIIMNSGKKILGYSLNDSGADFTRAAERAYANAGTLAREAGHSFADARAQAGSAGHSIEDAGAKAADGAFVVSTGYGRRNVPFSNETKTEISCHAKGSFFHFPHPHTLIDIGGQDSKVIKVDVAGKRVNFKMNRKCAAGTGAFIEELANRLKIPLGDLDGLARKAVKEVQLGSYCTVFTATEILTRIREGVQVENLVKGVFGAVIKRAMEMDPLEGDIVMSGGVVAHNPFLVEMFSTKLNREIFVPPLPQFTGAFGAALYAMEEEGGRHA